MTNRIAKAEIIGRLLRPHEARAWAAVISASLLIGAALSMAEQSSATGPSQNTSYAFATDEEEAAKVLGRAVPQPRFAPPGFARTQFSLESAPTDVRAASPRKVRQTFGIAGQDLALLTVFSATLGQSLDPVSAVQIGGRSFTVSTKTLSDGSTMVSYRWQLGELAAYFDINLVRGITRDVADRIVASVQ